MAVSRRNPPGQADAAAPGRGARLIPATVNLAGAAGAIAFARATGEYYLHTHRLIGLVFFAEEMWFAGAFLIRRRARVASRSPGDWLLALGGTLGGVLLRPVGLHPQWGVEAGLGLQLAGLAVVLASLAALGRSFGFVAADRGLVTRGPYALVRHPIYAAYILVQLGYVLQSLAWWNLSVMLLATSCNAGRALAEERVLAAGPGYGAYRDRVAWRLVPGAW